MTGVEDKVTGSTAPVAGLCILLCATACNTAMPDPRGSATEGAPAARLEAASSVETWGIEPVSLRPTLGGTMLDFRYRVVDAEKAKPLFDRTIKPYLFDPASGAALGMPQDTKLGALRSSPRNPPVSGKQYFILFANGQDTVKRDSRVTVVIGDCQLADIVVD